MDSVLFESIKREDASPVSAAHISDVNPKKNTESKRADSIGFLIHEVILECGQLAFDSAVFMDAGGDKNGVSKV